MDKIIKILKGLGIPYAYDHFAERESPEHPFICYTLPKSNHFGADGKVFFKANQCNIELYTDDKDPAWEELVEVALEDEGIFYTKSELWIDSEKKYEVLYQFELKQEAHHGKKQSKI